MAFLPLIGLDPKGIASQLERLLDSIPAQQSLVERVGKLVSLKRTVHRAVNTFINVI